MTSHANVGVGTLALPHPSTGTVKCRAVAGVETENRSGARHGSRCRGLWTRGPDLRNRRGHGGTRPGKAALDLDPGEVTGRGKALGYEAQELTQVMNRWAAARTPPQSSRP